MDQDSVRSPEITNGPGYSIPYTLYLHSAAWVLRRVVASLTGTGKLFDKIMSVPTPGLGEGKVSISVCIPQCHNVAQSPWPVLLVAEGGGFILGQPSDGEHIDRHLCDKVGMVVISVEYAKSPRYPYPHALLQLYEVIKWALSPPAEEMLGVVIDPSRVAVMGNSAGGNLAASLSLLLSFTSGPCASFRKGLPPHFRQVLQALIYPSVDLNRSYVERLGASDEGTQASSLPSWAATMMEASYLPPYIDKSQVFISPLKVEIPLLKSLQPPSAVVVTAGKDCLKLEAEKYAEKLRQGGVSVIAYEYPEAIHGFSHYKEGSKEFRKEDVEGCWEHIATALRMSFFPGSALA
ncbi:alpha/beta hydrolase fold-domain-containing protein [Ilyonectria destructans]|nr:alpha/beta hydrolase fold-domain-containing protein [Ilyonectria destructans]